MLKLRNMFFEADNGTNVGGTTSTDNSSNVTDINTVETTKTNTEEVKTFTQEQVNDMITKRLAREQEKIRKEFEAKYVTDVQKGVEDKMTEAEKLKSMTEKEREVYEFNKEKNAFEEQKKAFELAQLKMTSKGILTDKGYNSEQIEALSGFINYSNAEDVKASIDAFDKVIKEIVQAQTDVEINSRLATKTKPVTTSTVGTSYSYEDVLAGNCSYAQYMQHKRVNK